MYKAGAQSPVAQQILLPSSGCIRKLSQAFEIVADEVEIVAVGAIANALARKGSSVSTNTCEPTVLPHVHGPFLGRLRNRTRAPIKDV
jgi:hypothetical protein